RFGHGRRMNAWRSIVIRFCPKNSSQPVMFRAMRRFYTQPIWGLHTAGRGGCSSTCQRGVQTGAGVFNHPTTSTASLSRLPVFLTQSYGPAWDSNPTAARVSKPGTVGIGLLVAPFLFGALGAAINPKKQTKEVFQATPAVQETPIGTLTATAQESAAIVAACK